MKDTDPDPTSARRVSERLLLYTWLVEARQFDRALCDVSPRWFPGEGEEGAVVGAFFDLTEADVAAPHYRSPFVVYLMRGAEGWRLAAQVLGKSSGYNKGRSVPFSGPAELNIVPWVAGDLGTSIGVATGAALALRDNGSGGVCVCTFGDGTANRGDVHESLNIAAVWNLPIVFVCQNNGWSISEPEELYLKGRVADRALGYGMPGSVVDGQDVEAVRAAVLEASKRARRGRGPSLIEARTYRARGHWAADAETYRRRDQAEREPVDPIQLLASRLLGEGVVSQAELDVIDLTAKAKAAAYIAAARDQPDVTEADIGLEDVYP